MNLKHPLNIASRDFTKNEYTYYAWMRREAPVYKAKYSRWLTVYLLTRYEDVAATLKDPRFVRNRSNAKQGASPSPIWLPKSLRPLLRNMLVSDEPDHRRLRSLVHKAFTPRTVAHLQPRIEALTHALLDTAERQGQADLLMAYTLPLPATVIAEMIGVPEADRPQFLQWSQTLVVNPTSPRNLLRLYGAIRATLTYLRGLIAERRKHPQDDLLTALIQAEDAGKQLDEEELLAMVYLLLVAGYETTVNLIANGTRALLTHPDQLAVLRAHPVLIDSAVEEILRYDSPVQSTKPHYPIEDVVLHGVTIPQGAMVLLIIGSANRDETVFHNPDHFDITRTPNKHLGFGNGIHYCLGAPLARLEGKIALTNLIEHYPHLRLAVAPEELRFTDRPLLHRLETLPVVFG